MKRLCEILSFFVLVLGAATALSEPLSLSEIDAFAKYLDCRDNCEDGFASHKSACLSQCGQADDPWEKNGVLPLDRVDLELAILEYWDIKGGTLNRICYDGRWVRPAGTCGGEDCLSKYSAAECADNDGDGLKAWQEAQFGTSDAELNAPCAKDAQCSFKSTCVFSQKVGEGRCVGRPECGTGITAGSCKAYRLEIVEQNNTHVVIRVHYDYSPIPARVLDLYLTYNQKALSLIDARLMPQVLAVGKELQTKHMNDNLLRLIVLGSSSTSTIPFGPVVELVFSRVSDQGTSIGFSTSETARTKSQAPSSDMMKNELKDGSLWGSDVQVEPRQDSGPRLLLYYPFDEPSDPLAYSDVKDATQMCTIHKDCKNADPATKTKILAQLKTAQKGWNKVSQSIPGVRDQGAYFDGREDHLELPLLPAYTGARSFTLETWFYAEGEIADASPKVSQILFNQQDSQEKTSFGVGLAKSKVAGAVDLVWFTGDAEFGPASFQPISTVPALEWTYFAMSVQEGLGSKETSIAFYLDGAFTKTVTLDRLSFTSCPVPESEGNGFLLHKEGVGLPISGRPPETVFYATAQSNLYGIERMDPNGFARQEVIREGTSQAKDPDYSAVTGKLVYASSETGNFEIWISNEDGSNARPITRGFGDTARGIFARRPKWAPNASGIVFESNVYSVEHDYNCYGRTYQLYYIAYNPVKNEVAVPDPNSDATATLSELDFEVFGSKQSLTKVSLTNDSYHHYYGAVWLTGGELQGSSGFRGSIAFTEASRDYDERRILVGTVQSPAISDARPVNVPFAGSDGNGQSAELLDAYVDTATNRNSYLIARTEVGFWSADQFEVKSVVARGQAYDVQIFHSPKGYTANCWDTAKDGNCDPVSENLNRDNTCDIQDCYPAEVGDLYIKYPDKLVKFDFGGSVVDARLVDPNGLRKDVELSQVYTSFGEFIKIKVMSPFSSRPLPAGMVATLRFSRINNSTTQIVDYQVQKRSEKRHLVAGVEGGQVPLSVQPLTDISEARFSPDGTRVLMSGLENARPVLGVYDLSLPVEKRRVDKVSLLPQQVEGMDWSVGERFYPCQWVGATRNPASKRLKSAFHGGLDEMKMYSYARTAEAIRSEFERGHRWLDKAGESARPTSRTTGCTEHSQCSEYQLCLADGSSNGKKRCSTVPCGANGDCPRGGACTLLPVPLGGGEQWRFVCSAECSSNQECFEQECRNGLCRFCDAGVGGTNSCLECKKTPVSLPPLEPFMVVEGCPDRNSFICEDGSCYSECYAQENGQSRYLCKPGVEYCSQGRCVGIKWSWDDLSPSTMSGLAQMPMEDPKTARPWTSVAFSQIYPVTIKAYGVEDYLEPPQIVVEGQVLSSDLGLPQPYGSEWFEVGVITVFNKTKREAENDPNTYTLLSPYPMERIRLRLISPPFQNGNQGNHGFMDGEKHFCPNWPADEKTGSKDDCLYRATGSRAQVGYPVGIPRLESRRASNDPNQPYLWGGQPVVIVLEAKVQNRSVIANKEGNKNMACGYEGASPMEATRREGNRTVMNRLVFGSLEKERSAQKNSGLLTSGPAALVKRTDFLDKGWALLNCTMSVPEANSQMVAGAEFKVCYGSVDCNLLYPRTGLVGKVNETANGCSFAESTSITNEHRTKPCYEIMGGEVTLDYQSAPHDRQSALDFDLFRGGH